MNVLYRVERRAFDASELAPLARAFRDRTFALEEVPFHPALADWSPPRDRFDASAREAIVRSISAGLASARAPSASLAALERLRARGASVVVTGQQPGLFCSPLYSLYKALTALRLASELEKRWRTPVVALFWNHADDHDVAEVHHAFIQNVNLDLQKVGLAGMSSGRQPFSRIVLTEEKQRLGALGELLSSALPPSPHVDLAKRTFVPRDGESLARAFTRTMLALLGERGLVVLEPDWLRAELSRALGACVRADAPGALRAGARRLADAGFDVAIDPAEAALVFRVDASGRHALRSSGDRWRADGDDAAIDARDLAASIDREPAAFSAGALLRPLTQDLALPVAAYVGGWAELAYHAELGELRRALDAPRTPFVPRASCTLIDPETDAALRKLDLTLDQVLADPRTLEPDSTEPAPAVVERLSQVARTIERDVAALQDELAAIDRGLAQNLKRVGGSARSALEELAGKAARAHQNAAGKGQRHARRIANALMPRGEPQERVLGPLQFVARFGDAWIERLSSSIDPFDDRPLVVTFDRGDDPRSA